MARHTLSVTPVISPPHIFEGPTRGMFSSQARLPGAWRLCSCGWQRPGAVLFSGRKGCTAAVYCERLTCCLNPKPVVKLMRMQVSRVSDLAVCDLHEAPAPFALQQRCCAVGRQCQRHHHCERGPGHSLCGATGGAAAGGPGGGAGTALPAGCKLAASGCRNLHEHGHVCLEMACPREPTLAVLVWPALRNVYSAEQGACLCARRRFIFGSVQTRAVFLCSHICACVTFIAVCSSIACLCYITSHRVLEVAGTQTSLLLCPLGPESNALYGSKPKPRERPCGQKLTAP